MQFVFDNERPIYIQLVEQLQKQIISGKINPGEKLPSVRDLALLTKVNPNTMQRALTELEDLRLIYTERTNGKFVTKDNGLIKKYKDKFAKEKTKKYLQEMKELGINGDDVIQFIKN